MRVQSHCPSCGELIAGSLAHDRRAATWRVRVRLYDMTKPEEPQADSDPELDADKPGTLVCAGLKGVADTVAQLAAMFHGTAQLPGLETATLDAKIPGLRPTLSRRGGNAVWRLPYDTARTFSASPDHRPIWLARVDLFRVDAEPTVAEGPKFRRQT